MTHNAHDSWCLLTLPRYYYYIVRTRNSSHFVEKWGWSFYQYLAYVTDSFILQSQSQMKSLLADFGRNKLKLLVLPLLFFFLMLANILTIVVSCHKRLFRDDIPTLKTRTALLSQLCAREMPPCWTADMAHVWRHSPGRDGGRWPHPIMAPCRSYTSFPFTIAVIRYVHLLVLRLLVGQRVCFTFFLFTYLIGCVSKLKWLNLVRFMFLTSAALWRRLPWR